MTVNLLDTHTSLRAGRLEQYSGNSVPPPPPPPGPKSLDVQYSRRTQFPRNFGPRGTEFPRELGPPDRKLVGDRVPCDTGEKYLVSMYLLEIVTSVEENDQAC